ncbi:MAG: aminoglycoside phosphotransferase family protein [Ruminococcus sp.]|nr:aminoglycoside phosphotransferase family protein [Ruminococcus sp.]
MEIVDILRRFGIENCGSISGLDNGHINRTFLAETPEGRYIVQSLNSEVFCEPEAVMENISAVCGAFMKHTDEYVSVPQFLTVGEDNFILCDGELWRVYPFTCESGEYSRTEKIFCSGRAYGAFIRIMSEEKPKLKTVCEGFHDIKRYFGRLQAAMAASPMKKIDSGIIARLGSICDTLDHVFPSSFRKRIIHGDAKADNVILGDKCSVIDLDTVMYGYAAIDFGDLIRSVCRGSDYDYSVVRNAVKGFAEGLGGILSTDETDSLYYGILWVTAELAIRYLTDYISEEHYFRDKTPSECLVRANELIVQLNNFILHGDEITEMIYAAFRKAQ